MAEVGVEVENGLPFLGALLIAGLSYVLLALMGSFHGNLADLSDVFWPIDFIVSKNCMGG